MESKATDSILEAACRHQGIYSGGLTFRRNTIASGGIDPSVREERPCYCEVFARHRYRALVKVCVEHVVNGRF
jgi:hypothetical protein